MTRLWIVILLYGKVGGVIGPLPYDGAECHRRVAELSGAFDQRFEADAFAGSRPPRRDGKDLVRTDFSFECRESIDPPTKEIDLTIK